MEYRKKLVAVDWSLGVLSPPSHRRNINQAIRKISNIITPHPSYEYDILYLVLLIGGIVLVCCSVVRKNPIPTRVGI